MAVQSYVNDGTASVTAGQKTVTFAGVSVALMRASNPFFQGGKSGVIASLDADTNTAQLVDNWGGETAAAQPYTVITIPESAELALTTRKWNQYLNGPILSIAEMMGDAAPTAGDILVWDAVTSGWVTADQVTTADIFNSVSSADVPSAATCDVGAVDSQFATITGDDPINSLGDKPTRFRLIKFADSLTLSNNAPGLVLKGGVTRNVSEGETSLFVSDTAGNWQEVFTQGTVPVFQADLNNIDQTGLSSATNSVALSHAPVDTRGWFDGATHRYTPKVAGLYLFCAMVNVSVSGSAGDAPQAYVYKNGGLALTGSYVGLPGGSSGMSSSVSGLLKMNGTTDYVDLRAFIATNVSGIRGEPSQTFLTGIKVGD